MTMPGTAVVALPTHKGNRPVRDRLASSISRAAYLAKAVPGLVPLE
jgi:hypothetical protein